MSAIVETVFDFLDDGDKVGALKLAQSCCRTLSEHDALRMGIRFKKAGILSALPDLVKRLGASFVSAGEMPIRALSLPSPASPKDLSLDFFVFPTLRGASRAAEIFINLHPQLHAAPRVRMDVAFETGEWTDILREANSLRDHLPGLKSGIVLHDGVGTMRTFLGVASLVGPERPWIQLVREPLSAVTSSINHMINGDAHGYSFQNIGLRWQFSENIATASAEDFEPPSVAKPLPSDVDGYLRRSVCMKQDFRFGLPYAEYFGNWTVLDVDDLSAERVDDGMAFMFAALGVDPSFRHPWFREQMHGKLPRFLYNNPVQVGAFDYPLILMLGLPGDNLRCHDLRIQPPMKAGGYLEISQVENNDTLAKVGVPGGSCALLLATESWAALPQKIRLHLMDSGLLQRYFVQTLIPRWASNVAAVMNWIAPAQIKALTPAQRDYVFREISADYEAFLARHPALAERWHRTMSLDAAPAAARA